MYHTFSLTTELGDSMVNITDQVRAIVKESNVQSGICFVIVGHTTAAVTINSYLDPDTARDIVDDIRRLVPTRTDFHHIFDTPADAAAHIKASIIGNTETVLIEENNLVLGHSQGLLFFEFDGPRTRQVMVKIIAG
ncbi:MAG TPA: secondary thiamine-phosphate synthase enzyme YjbQ [Roseiflexaceae bacterium]|nr:secondary thiamine-phosphate synthase enzyme YjbQ [Roseiflexaceae bacterium]HMP40172.1 secondary thiamine-phosphate synthase enzyme YjbQ [Roseiflexaceae bacterium]